MRCDSNGGNRGSKIAKRHSLGSVDIVQKFKQTQDCIGSKAKLYKDIVGVDESQNRRWRHSIGTVNFFIPIKITKNSNLSKFERIINAIDRGPYINVTNDVNDEGIPDAFTYVESSIFGTSVPKPDLSFLCGCDCLGNCQFNEKCLCKENNNCIVPYDSNGRLVAKNGAIYECNSLCLCDQNCGNRIVGNGRKVKLDIKMYDNGKGWGVVAGEDIEGGTFISQYVGEIITNEESNKRSNLYGIHERAYIFDIDYSYDRGDACEYAIDARHYGNISHFFNHSCNPNTKVRACFIDNMDPRLHLNAFFAIKNIKKGEEIVFDYLGLDGSHPDPDTLNGPRDFPIKCLCGSKKCRKYIYL